VLAIGGLDPGGGAGLLADARAIAHTGAFACGAAAVLTVQSTSGLRSATAVARSELIAECTEVVKRQHVRALKVGALGSVANARAIGDFLAIHRELPSVVDTVMVPTRGAARLLDARAVSVLRDRVMPHATLVTVNAPEAEALTGARVTRLDEAREAARTLLRSGCRAILLKGGHLGGDEATDLLALAGDDGTRRGGAGPRILELTAPRLALPGLHGGGCVLASLVAGRLAVTFDAHATSPTRAIEQAVRWAKAAHHAALREAADVGGDLRVLFA